MGEEEEGLRRRAPPTTRKESKTAIPFSFCSLFFSPNLLMGRAALFGGSSTVHWTHAMHSMLTVACRAVFGIVRSPKLILFSLTLFTIQ
jgi:hypothetical protein